MLVLRLGRSGLARRLLAMAMFGTAGPLSGIGAIAAIHPPVVVGVGAAIGVGAMALMLGLATVLGLTVVGMRAVAVMIGMTALVGAMALMLGVNCMALLSRSGRLRHGGGDEGEGRRGGDENGLHDDSLLND